jgi:hypothetical protein
MQKEIIPHGVSAGHNHHTVAITGRSYSLKVHPIIAGKGDKNENSKSNSSDPSTAEPPG